MWASMSVPIDLFCARRKEEENYCKENNKCNRETRLVKYAVTHNQIEWNYNNHNNNNNIGTNSISFQYVWHSHKHARNFTLWIHTLWILSTRNWYCAFSFLFSSAESSQIQNCYFHTYAHILSLHFCFAHVINDCAYLLLQHFFWTLIEWCDHS